MQINLKAMTQKREEGYFNNNAKPVIMSVVFGLITVGILLTIESLIFSFSNLSSTLIPAFVIVTLGIGAFVSGFVLAKWHRQKGMWFGVFAGVCLFLTILIISFLNFKGFGIVLFFKFALMLVCGAIGGIYGVNRKPKRF